jgi:hypothetical protein
MYQRRLTILKLRLRYNIICRAVRQPLFSILFTNSFQSFGTCNNIPTKSLAVNHFLWLFLIFTNPSNHIESSFYRSHLIRFLAITLAFPPLIPHCFSP